MIRQLQYQPEKAYYLAVILTSWVMIGQQWVYVDEMGIYVMLLLGPAAAWPPYWMVKAFEWQHRWLQLGYVAAVLFLQWRLVSAVSLAAGVGVTAEIGYMLMFSVAGAAVALAATLPFKVIQQVFWGKFYKKLELELEVPGQKPAPTRTFLERIGVHSN